MVAHAARDVNVCTSSERTDPTSHMKPIVKLSTRRPMHVYVQDANKAERSEDDSLYNSSDDEELAPPDPVSSTHTSLASRRPAALTGLNIAGTSARRDVTPIALPNEPESDSVDQEKPKQRIYKHAERHLLVSYDLSFEFIVCPDLSQ